jgi:hypothetical protein
VRHTSFLFQQLDGSAAAFVVVGQRNNTKRRKCLSGVALTPQLKEEKNKVLEGT